MCPFEMGAAGPAVARRGLRVWMGVVVAIAVVALVVAGIRMAAFNAKVDEAHATLSSVAQGIARCSTARGYVPVQSQEAFICAGFEPGKAQDFKYEWVRESETAGFVRADADFARLELDVVCGASGCRAATEPRETRR